MINTLKNGYKVSFTEGANHFIHFLRRIPFIGKHIPEALYRETKTKLVLAILIEVFSIMFKFFKKALYLLLMVFLPASYIAGEEANVGPIFIHILFFLNFIAGPIIRDIFMEKTDKKGFLMVVLMREDPKKYYLSEIIYRNSMDFICFLLPVILIGVLVHISPLKSIILLVEFIAFRFIVEGLILFMWDKRKKGLGDFLSVIIVLIASVLAYALPLIAGPMDFQGILFNLFFFLVVMALASAALIYIFE